ncbi:hypothetical protein HK098_006792 [Nowakowskiella sp. JEL0407]|nr:hypothetical protein HK098_006792 [Nowakowskiella sp. JEL0407]
MLAESHEEIINEPHSSPKRIVCIAVDASAHSKNAFNYALENIVRTDDQIILLNVRPVANPIAGVTQFGDLTEELEQMDEAAHIRSHSLLKEYGAIVLSQSTACRAIALHGDAREELVKKVDELNADLLIMGSRGLGNFKRAVLGSVSDYVIHHVKCAVLVTKIKSL